MERSLSAAVPSDEPFLTKKSSRSWRPKELFHKCHQEGLRKKSKVKEKRRSHPRRESKIKMGRAL